MLKDPHLHGLNLLELYLVEAFRIFIPHTRKDCCLQLPCYFASLASQHLQVGCC